MELSWPLVLKKKKSRYKYSLVKRDPVSLYLTHSRGRWRLGLGCGGGYEADTQVCQIRRRKKQSNEDPPPSFYIVIFKKNSHRSIPNAHTYMLAGVFLFFFFFFLSQKRTLRQLLSTNRAWVDSLGSLIRRDAQRPWSLAQRQPRRLCSAAPLLFQL